MNADLQAYLLGNDDRVFIGIHLIVGTNDNWYTDYLQDLTVSVDGQSTSMQARACMAPWPKRMGNGDFSTTVSIDDVDREIKQQIIGVDFGAVTCDIHLFLESHIVALGSSAEPVLVMPFRAIGVVTDGFTAQLRCKRQDVINLKYPVDIYDPSKYPGLS